ncbi:MAG: putative molybdenum carrier protein [Gammaproteobacteria bacterium]
MGIKKIISGGQTGVDRAALDVAINNHIPHGGWCPRGRIAEDGVINNRYALRETHSGDYSCRTKWNVRDADATLILNSGSMQGGTALTAAVANKYNKPCLVVDVDKEIDISAVSGWIKQYSITTLNIAGPRESKCPGIYDRAGKMLEQLIMIMKETDN